MFLSNRDLIKAMKRGELIVIPRPPPDRIGATSIDLRLDSIDAVRIWNRDAFAQAREETGDPRMELRIGKFDFRKMSRKYLMPPTRDRSQSVFVRDDEVIVKPYGFVLWQTKEVVGTHRKARLICFIEGKSTKARTGILVHLTAPTIHAGWSGNVTLEIANVGPFDLVLAEDDIIAQITVARISSPPLTLARESLTDGQTSVTGRPDAVSPTPRPSI
ncbi:MAG: dCTP deaminase [Planctomycetota bacterium]|nr:dCTP deaminase [Planctomycetota bacterium]